MNLSPYTASSECSSYRDQLRQSLLARKARHPQYSLRSFATYLGVSRTTLSDVLAGKRHFSAKNALRVANRLAFSPAQTQDLLVEINGDLRSTPEPAFRLLDEDTFKIIAEWYHYAILNLAKTKLNHSDPWRISTLLGITPMEARVALMRLQRLGFVRVEKGRIFRTVVSLDTLTEKPSQALRAYHKQNLYRAETSLERDSLERREFASIVFATRPERVKKAKKMIRQFRDRLSRYLECENPTEVYTLAMQLFPVTIRRK